MSIVQIELVINAWSSASEQLCSAAELPAETLELAAKKGALWHRSKANGKFRRLRTLEKNIKPQSELALNFNSDVLEAVPQTPTLVSDEGEYSVWDKPAGMLCQGSKWSDHTTITEVVRTISAKPSFLVHRLDKAASGLIVVAHTSKATTLLSQQFAERKIDKRYQCVVDGVVGKSLPWEIDAEVDKKTAKSVVLEAKLLETAERSLLTVQIVTGRKHQIRAHLSQSGFPIVGDRMFNNACKENEDLQLRAVQLGFNCMFSGETKQFSVAGITIE